MAKMIDRVLQGLRLRRLNRLRDQRTFLSSYLPLRIQAIEERRERRIRMISRRAEAILGPLAIAAGIEMTTLATAHAAAVARIEERFRWQEKALTQSKKRVLERNTDTVSVMTAFDRKTAVLHAKKAKRIQAIDAAFAPRQENRDEARQRFEAKAVTVNFGTETALVALRQKAERAIASLQATYQIRTSRLDGDIQSLRQQLLVHQDETRSADRNLPEGVILGLRNLSMRFGGLLAVDNLSFDVKQGEIFGLIGPNGAGKTTIFNCITRFYRPTGGEMLYRKNPVEVIRLNDYPVHNIIRQGIVRTFQNVELVWELSILDNLLVGAHTMYRTGFFGQLLHTQKLRREEEVMRARALSVLKTLELLPFALMIPYGLPYGILKKVELARTLMANPKLIILDEPAAGLNDMETENLATLIKRIRDEYQATIFLVEHDMGLVMDVCDTVCAISFGKMLAIGTPAQIQADKQVRSAYLGEES